MNVIKKIKNTVNVLKWTLILGILPLIFGYVLYLHIVEIRKSKNDFPLTKGKVELIGFTEKNHKGKSMRSIRTKTKVFFVKLNENDTLYSYYFKNSEDYNKLFSDIKNGEFVKIYNKGFEDTQNTVDIIQLENNEKILINKKIYDERNYLNVLLLSLFLLLYFSLPIFIYYKSKMSEQKNIIKKTQ
mgnify:CR=1 FL=1